jgi:hypothetical protein
MRLDLVPAARILAVSTACRARILRQAEAGAERRRGPDRGTHGANAQSVGGAAALASAQLAHGVTCSLP